MAERRMLAKTIIESDRFSNMPPETQMLYVRMNLAADDDGFVSNPRGLMRQCGASDDSMKLLITKKFVLTFGHDDNFVLLIRHWRIHNYIRSDRYRASAYRDIMRCVYLDENKAYSVTPGLGKKTTDDDEGTNGTQNRPSFGIPDGIPDDIPNDIPDGYQRGYQRLTQDSIGKVSIDKDSIDKISLEQERKGECEGEAPATAPAGDPAREKRIAELKESIARCKRLNFSASYFYDVARMEGIAREELEDG